MKPKASCEGCSDSAAQPSLQRFSKYLVALGDARRMRLQVSER